jgi:precorrin-3B synthase
MAMAEARAGMMGAQAVIRGACPSLAVPMETGDGLLVRLRPIAPGLTIGQLRALAESAKRHGNGLVEVTARGNLQLRGLQRSKVDALARDVFAAGIDVDAGVAIEMPPLSGLGTEECADAPAMATALRQHLAASKPIELAPKFSIVIDGGSRPGLSAVAADIRLTAIPAENGPSGWSLAIAGTQATARVLGIFSGKAAAEAVVKVMQAVAARGPQARARDIGADTLDMAGCFIARDDRVLAVADSPSPVGTWDLGGSALALGVGLSFGQVHADQLVALLDAAEMRGAIEIRMAPDHCLLILGLPADAIGPVRSAAASGGFIIDPDDPAGRIAACAGAGACTSGHYATKTIARDMAACLPDLLDTATTLHFSGCAKGCAHPGNTAVAVAGASMGYGIVVNGSASGKPMAYIEKDGLKPALLRLNQLVKDKKGAGESAGQCLTRLGTDAIAAALGQG